MSEVPTGSRKLWTIGYAGRTPEGFLTTLHEAGVRCVIDVRELPLSRKRGFSKSGLQALLKSEGLEYLHQRDLGVPRALRHELKRGLALSDYLASFRERLVQQPASVAALARLASAQPSCLMCVEAQFQECHRAIVADVLQAAHVNQFEVHHLS